MKPYVLTLKTIAETYKKDPVMFEHKYERDFFLVRGTLQDTSPVLGISEKGFWELKIGSDNNLDFHIKDWKMSNHHATMTYQGVAYIKDENSERGTFLDGEKLDPKAQVPLLPGTEVAFGSERWYFHNAETFGEFLRRYTKKSDSGSRRLEELVRA